MSRHHVGKEPAEAEPHGADLAGTAVEAAQVSERRLEIGDAIVDIEFAVKPEGFFEGGLVLRIDLHARLDTPEQVGAQGDVAGRGHIIGDVAHPGVDAEYLLNDGDTRTRARRGQSQIAHEFAVTAGNCDFASRHANLPNVMPPIIRA